MKTYAVFLRTDPTKGNIPSTSIASLISDIKLRCNTNTYSDSMAVAQQEILALEDIGLNDDLPGIGSDQEE